MHKRTRGFTLIETIMYIALATVVLYLVSGLYAVMISIHAKNRAIADVSLSSESALAHITQTIRDARHVTDPTVGLTSSEIALQMRDDAPYPSMSIYVLDGVIMMQAESQPPVPITPSNIVVTDLQFANMSSVEPFSIRISFTASSETGGRSDLEYTDTFYATATTR